MLRHLKLKMKIKITMSFCIYDVKLLEKQNAIWRKIQDLKNTELNARRVHDDRYIKTDIVICGDKFDTNMA